MRPGIIVLSLIVLAPFRVIGETSEDADCEVGAIVVKPIVVEAPGSGANSGELGAQVVGGGVNNQAIAFTVKASSNYALDFTASVTESDGSTVTNTASCHWAGSDTKTTVGPNGSIELIKTTDRPLAGQNLASNVLEYGYSPTLEEFTEKVYYHYHAPHEANPGAECAIVLRAAYQ